MKGMPDDKWQVLSQILELKNRWLTIIAEKLRDSRGEELEYWRVEKSDSLIILTILNNRLVLPKPTYRPGVSSSTIDFCGGRVAGESSHRKTAAEIVVREFGLHVDQPFSLINAINVRGWNVDSSFSNQRLFGFIAELSPDIIISTDMIGESYTLDDKSLHELLENLVCLQCRALLLEWLLIRMTGGSPLGK